MVSEIYLRGRGKIELENRLVRVLRAMASQEAKRRIKCDQRCRNCSERQPHATSAVVRPKSTRATSFFSSHIYIHTHIAPASPTIVLAARALRSQLSLLQLMSNELQRLSYVCWRRSFSFSSEKLENPVLGVEWYFFFKTTSSKGTVLAS